MSIPKEPRQIMINLMYLVLTALLALNVSNEILNAFKVLAKGISDSNVSIDRKTTEVYEQIKENEKLPGQGDKVRPFRLKADEVVLRCNEVMKYFDTWKERIVIQAGGRTEDGSIKAEGDIDATTSLLVEKRGGDTMRQKITELRKFMLESVLPKDSGSISPLMPLRIESVKPSEHNPTGDWNIGYFEHMPTVAAIAMFSKFQNDIRSSEALVIAKLYEEAHLKDVKFDTIAAVAVPKQSYALAGDKIEASILLAAFNKGNKPTVNISQGGGSKKEPVNGVVPWETIATGTGLQTVKGSITLNTGDAPIVRNWQFEYMVGTTGASLQLDKMNVFYIGVPNPVTVAAAGYSVEDVSLAVPNSKADPDPEKGKGHYNIFVDKVGTVDVAINAKTKEGPVKQVGKMTVRVKRIPDPVAQIMGQSSGGMSASTFRAQIAPAAVLKDFEFDTRFQIVSFSFYMLPKGKDIVGPYEVKNPLGCRFDQNKDVEKAIKMAKAGDRIIIEEIKAVGPDKTPRKLNGILLTLN